MAELARVLETVRSAVEAASAASMKHYRAGVRVELKPDRSPVTAADREAEAAIVAAIRAAFPQAAILGEESGAHEGAAGSRFIVDPLDGTRGFSRGGAFWGPLVAFEEAGEVVAGAMGLPVLGKTYWAARGMGAFRDGQRLRVSGVSEWSDATLSLGELGRMMVPPRRDVIAGLASSCASTRCYGDLAACAMLLDGLADAWIETRVQIWDLAPLKILVEEAGGVFTDLEGKPTHTSGSAVATNGKLQQHVLAALRAA